MNDEITEPLKVATPKRGTIKTLTELAECRICGGRIQRHGKQLWFHTASGDAAC